MKAGEKLAGMRCIPLLLEEQQVEDAKKIAKWGAFAACKTIRAQNNGHRYYWLRSI